MGRKILLLSLVAVCGLAIGCGVSGVTPATGNVANVLKIEAEWDPFEGGHIIAYIEPTKYTIADTPYAVVLYKYDTVLDKKLIRWMQQDVDTLTPKVVAFRLSDADTQTYLPFHTPWTSSSSTEPAWTEVFSVKVEVAPTSTTPPTTPSAATLSAILGKWRHGLPEECPPQMSQQQYEELKELPESKTYYLEFFEDSNVQFICEEQIVDGTYTFISGDEVEISWSVLGGNLAEFFDSHGVYQIVFSEDKMTLWGGLEECATYLRVD
jgi:hypothetical protein